MRGWLRGRDPSRMLLRIGRSRVILGLVFAFGLVVRWDAIRRARFSLDEASFWEVALDIAQGRSFPLVGHPISGTDAGHPGSLFFVMMALPQLFTRDPLAGSAFIALLNLLAVALVFFAIREGWSQRAAVIFLFLAIASPWVIEYGDRIWPGDLDMTFGAAVLFALVRCVRVPRSRAVFALAVLLIAGAQIHLSIGLWWIVSAVTLVFCRARVHVRALAFGVLAGILSFVPYFVHELGSNFSNTRLVFQHAQGDEFSTAALGDLLLYFLGFGGLDIQYLFARGYWYDFEHSSLGLEWAFAFLGVVAAVWRFAARPRRLARLRGRPLGVACIAGVAAICVLYTISRKSGYAHYVNVLLWLGMLPAITFLWFLARRRVLGFLGVGYVLVSPIAGAYLLDEYLLLEEEISIPVQKEVTRFIAAGGRPFVFGHRLDHLAPETFQRVSERYHEAPWRESADATTVFMLLPANPDDDDRRGALHFGTVDLVHTSPDQALFYDHATRRNGIHACPLGTFVVGIHLDSGQLLCSRAFGAYESDKIDLNTQVAGMHGCPWGTAMTGVDAETNRISCATAGPLDLSVDPDTERLGMHSCPKGTVAVGLHDERNLLLCGKRNQ